MTATDEEARTCWTCDERKPADEFYRQGKGRLRHCKACVRQKDRDRYKATNGKDRVFDQSLRRLYGITIDQYRAKEAEQQGRCGLCRCIPQTDRRMHVDHDHATGKLRDLLCHHCNLLLGNAQDSVERLRQAIAYLDRHGGQLGNHPAYTLAAKLGERLQTEEEK
ncbi:endonuclease domain-containing protein [Streptomyces lavendofoliae]|uniref:Recombination endonuclease VII n=1 Tax=Streptomyces lavendofoliae TaxID=67314 RepID=A0A918I256_9ACTN|nr:endonuclease domain-containing protein [Streptomyces lavendofoliae]GGU54675.1 hypothetical protein GCM10010274_49470 [Streptomyces lavendofoliae]